MNYLKLKLKEKNMSQSELARRIGVSKQYVYLLYRNEKPSLETFMNIVTVLDLDLKEAIKWITSIKL